MARPAFLDAYQEAHAQLLTLSEQHGEVGVLEKQTLQAAAQKLVQSLEANESFAPPYVLLAAIFLCLQKRQLAEKYLDLAAEIAPTFPALLELKKHLASPNTPVSAKKAKAIAAAAIHKVQNMEPVPTKTKRSTGIQRLFQPLLPLIGSPDDLEQAVGLTFPPGLSSEDIFDVYAAMTGQTQGSDREVILSLQQTLGKLDKTFARSPLRFAQTLAGSPAGVLRQLHLLLDPLRERYSTSEALARPFEDLEISAGATEALFDLMHRPHWEAPAEQLQQLTPLFTALQPDLLNDSKLDISHLLERLKA